jgi:hypothetical protein
MKKVKVTKRDKISYDPHLLDGIEYIDIKSAMCFVKSVISADVYDRKSPYVPVRMLVKFFDKESGVLRHGRGGSADLVKYLKSQADVRKAIASLTMKHSELLNLIYEQKQYVGTELIERVSWKLKAIVEDVQCLLVGISKSECTRLFGHTEAINGSPDGRLVGLREIVLRANDNLYEIREQIAKLEAIMKKGKNPMEYACVAAYR